MNVSEAIVEQLVAEDTDHVFGIIGSAFVDITDLFPPAGIDFVSVRHEQNAVHMADGYVQALNGEKPGICISQNGPGVTNTVTGLRTAQQNDSPVITLSPTATRSDTGTDAYQEADTLSILREVVEWEQRLEDPDRAPEFIRTAFREALAKDGPANVEFPRDIIYENCTVDILSPNQYRQTDAGPAAESDIVTAANLIEQADSPAIIVGSAGARADVSESVAALAERLNAPVANAFLNNDAFPASHPLSVGTVGFQGSKAAHELLSDADVLVAVGHRLPQFERGPVWGVDWFPADADIVQIHPNPSQIGRTATIACGLLGDPDATTRKLVDHLANADDAGADDPRSTSIREAVREWEQELRTLSESSQTPIHPRRALMDIADTIPDDTMVCLDVGNIVAMARAYFGFERPGNFIPAGPYGGIAFAWPAAIGASIARPNDQAIAVVGDGAFSTSMAETLTAVREEVSPIACVMNNGQWGAEKNNQLAFYNERLIGADLPENPDYAEVARDMGAHGIRVEDPDEVQPALEEAMATDAPSVLDIIIDPDIMVDPFRSDDLNEPRRMLKKYRQPGDSNY